MKNGKWRAQRMIDGQRRSKLFDSKRDATSWEVVQQKEDWIQVEIPAEILTVFSLATAYLSHAKDNFVRKTFERKRLAMRRLFQTIHPELAPEALKKPMFLNAMKNVKAEFGSGAANTLRKEVSAMWVWAVDVYDLDGINPASSIKKYVVDEKPAEVPTEADFWTVHAAAKPDDQLMLLFYFHTAARKDEGFRLRWNDVDLERGLVQLGTRKKGGGMKFDWLPLTNELHEKLKAHKKQAKSVYVFCRENGQPYTSRGKYMRRICERVNVKPFGFHGIRHLTASLLIASSDLEETRDSLRHRNVETTNRYIHKICGKTSALNRVFDKKEDHSADTLRSINMKQG
ncbi:site-specific integrase [Maridesulfovibrio ferrireducens]|uniref:tyrosine-type recombinase/integrase n=1 Tax=Maridesulfovibrio ferrireducens TaxID=246191 RepID=UPI0026F32040|nr:site-specific integrase [Maridesulfovibrio ferrireducens]